MDAEVKELYAGPLDEFVQRRNALARTLRQAGEREAADEVSSLRKPTVAAWALNQLVRRRPSHLQRFLEVADRLRRMQHQAMGSGLSSGDMRATISTYRESLEDLSRQATAILQQSGSSAAAHIAEVTASLQAAAVDDEARRQLHEGTVTRPFAAPGLAVLTPGLTAPAAEPSPGDSEPAASQSRQEEGAATRRARDEARRRRHEAQQRLRGVEQAAERLDRDAASAEKRAQQLARDAAEAAREAHEARQRADMASEEVQRARSELDEAGRMLEQAERGFGS